MPQSEKSAVEISTRDFSYDIGPSGRDSARAVVVETPINVLYGGVGFAVMMATPQDLEDFAFGFSFTEGIIRRAEDIRGLLG